MIKKPTKKKQPAKNLYIPNLNIKTCKPSRDRKEKLKKKKKKGKTFLTITHEIVRKCIHKPFSTEENINELQKVGVIQRIFLDYNVITLEKLATKIALFK